jgi:hypothetical protein
LQSINNSLRRNLPRLVAVERDDDMGEISPQAWIAIFRQPDNAIVGQVPVTDAAGNFSFTALEGFEYNLIALQGEKSSEGVPFSLGKGPEVVRLVLDVPQAIRQ